MKQAQETGKRIVSKGEYVKRCVIQAWAIVAGAVIILSGICGFFVIFITLHELATNSHAFFRDTPVTPAIVLFLVFGLVAIAACSLLMVSKGVDTLQYAKEIDTPLTRANTADLSAPDSLVRASQEPVQAQEAVLLRAAMGETQDGQEEAGQLLRAATGGREQE